MRQRMIKSAEEIEVIKHGARIGDLGGEAIKAAIREGITEYEVALIGTEAMVHEIAKTFPHREVRDTWVWFQSGINTDGAHNWATTRKLQRGDILSLNCFPMTSRLLHRTGAHPVPRRARRSARLELWNVNVEVHKRGLELIKPGAVCKDIAAELNEIFIGHGLLPNRTFGYGHSFGVLSHYYGREAGLELREDIDTVLEPGMVVSMEPMITVARRRAGRRRLPRARHPGHRRGRRRREHHQVRLRSGKQHHRRARHHAGMMGGRREAHSCSATRPHSAFHPDVRIKTRIGA